MFLVCSSLLGRSNDQALIHHILTTVRFPELCDDNAALLEWLECQHKEHLLRQISRDRFFADGEFWRSSLPLKDVRNAQDEIFRSSEYLWKWKYLCGKVEIFCICRLFHVEGLKKSSGQLVQLLASLEQDKAIRGGLEPAFTEFLKSSRLHPHARVLEQCILSLLWGQCKNELLNLTHTVTPVVD